MVCSLAMRVWLYLNQLFLWQRLCVDSGPQSLKNSWVGINLITGAHGACMCSWWKETRGILSHTLYKHNLHVRSWDCCRNNFFAQSVFRGCTQKRKIPICIGERGAVIQKNTLHLATNDDINYSVPLGRKELKSRSCLHNIAMGRNWKCPRLQQWN